MQRFKTVLFYFGLIVWIIVSICLAPPSALSQGSEFERFRSTDYQTPLIGKELAAEYYLGIGDMLNILVWKNPDLSRTTVISPDGKIHYPLIGAVKAANLTIPQLQEKIKEKLSTYIRYPDVTVTVVKTAGKKILVLGEVSYPGVYTYQGRINAIEAIALAGHVTRDAKRESIIIVSNNLTEHPEVKRINLFRAIRKGTSDPNFMLKAGDIVYVPRNFIADFNKFMSDLGDWLNTAGNASVIKIWDWRREIRWLYQRNLKTLTNK